MNSILIVEDTDSLREVLATVLACEGYDVTAVASAEEGLEWLSQKEFVLVLSDLKLPKMNGLEFLSKSKEINRAIPVVVMTAYGSIDIAVKALKLGATDFVTKPFDPAMLCELISQVAEHRRIVDRTFSGAAKNQRKIITQSPKLEEVLLQARKVAPLSTTVLILGESGTGKELLARYIHQQSRRAEERFVAVNCASMPAELLESEFFGHEAGSFTGATERRVGLFEVASEGTLFLDEIGNMPPELQIKLLRTLQESEIKRIGSNHVRKVNTRVISATNCDIEEMLKTRRLREDLYYRLGVVILEIPPLRERREDIALLAKYFVKSLGGCNESKQRTILPEALKMLVSYSWPGNVRELENVIERALIFSDGHIGPESIEFDGQDGTSGEDFRTLPELAALAVKETEIEAIKKALESYGGNKSKAAKLLGVSYKTLLNKIKEYRLESPADTLPS